MVGILQPLFGAVVILSIAIACSTVLAPMCPRKISPRCGKP